jgi:energy-coupling factor transport system ATP-binding protein
VLAHIPLVPPLQELARALGWQPLPLTIKEGRRQAAGYQLSALGTQDQGQAERTSSAATQVAVIHGVHYGYGDHEALYDLSLELRRGELLALMGRNGSGKSTLLRLLVGLLRPQRGRIELLGRNIAGVPVEELAASIGYVPQDPRSLLFHDTLREELEFTLAARRKTQDEGQKTRQHIASTLEQLGIAHLAETYPRSLSGGEAQRAALAAVLVGEPPLLLLDEPTRGLDYHTKAELAALLRRQCAASRTVIMATHDVELVAACADRVALLGDGELIAEGSVAELLGNSLIFSSQIAKLFPGSGWLTAQDALRVLSAEC